MKQTTVSLFVLFICLLPIQVWSGDDPCAATMLSTSSSDFILFDNYGNTDSGIEAPLLGGYLGDDIWFSFIMPSSEFIFLVQPGSMTDPAVAIYSGDCNTPLLIYNVTDNNCNGDVGPEVLIDELTPGEEYFIRVWAEDGSGNGTFGLFLGPDVPLLLDFEVFADASIIGDCIELTPEQNGQQGCAWYQLQVDFSQPFTHEMTANFGDQDGSGADGICLVYQSNGPGFCGAVGGGIGALEMPNSAIFEFDTWQNGIYSDPFDDHVAFNVNGNMAHPSSIDGPVSLSNIEDGNDHNILFDWNPAGNLFELYFDGNLVLSGSYDIINNCFGGNNLAYWGYTSSTGAANNNHIICPIVIEYTPAPVSYEEVTICAGDSYNGWTESGFYISEESDMNGCIYQIHTRLTVDEESPPYLLEKYICEGELFEVEGDIFFEEGFYIIETETENGCDSTIHLDLKVIIPSLEIQGENTLFCNRDSIWLTIDFEVNYPIADVDFFWNLPGGGSSQSDSIQATTPGIYRVFTFINYEDVLCQVSGEFEIFIDTLAPVLEDIDDLTVLCNTPDSLLILSAPTDTENLNFQWLFEGSYISSSDTIDNLNEGQYQLIATDTINGCMDTTVANVFVDEDIPQIEMTDDTLIVNCQYTEYQLQPTIDYQEPGIVYWDLDGAQFSTDITPTIDEPGLYTLNIIDANGCITEDSIRILKDTLAPIVIAEDIILACDETEYQIDPITDNENVLINWMGPAIIEDDFSPILNTAGVYSVIITDTTNQCSAYDTLIVDILGPSPEINITGDQILNCYFSTQIILGNVDQENAIINWYDESNNSINTNSELTVSEQGLYTIEAISQSGCSTRDSILITEDFVYPTITLESDTLDCDNLVATIDANILDGTIESWTTADGSSPTTSPINTEIAGTYTLNAINIETGCTNTESIEVIDGSNPPSYNFINNTISCNEPQINLALELMTNYESVTWTYPDGTTTNELSPLTNENGDYQLHIEVEGSCDVDTMVTISIDTIPPSYDVNFGLIDCNNIETYLNLDNDQNVDLLNITSPSGSQFSELTNTVTEDGIYLISATATNGCNTSTEIEISSLITTPEVLIEQDDVVNCNTPSAIISAISNNPNIEYSWSDEMVNIISSNNEISVIEGGNYLLEITDENGCTNNYTVFIEENFDVPAIELFGENISCDYPIATLYFESTNSLSENNWSIENQVISNEQSVDVLSSGLYVLEAIGNNGCTATDSIMVSANFEEPQLQLLSPDTITLPPGGMATVSILELSTETSTYDWYPTEGLSCSDCLNPTITEFVHDEYTLTAINSYGCINTITLFVREKKLNQVTIPNIFSPSSNDGSNDQFTLYGNENIVIINEMYIYDRWGSLIFTNQNFAPNYPELGWDGTYKRSDVISGVYVYLFRVTTVDGEILTFTGDVTRI